MGVRASEADPCACEGRSPAFDVPLSPPGLLPSQAHGCSSVVARARSMLGTPFRLHGRDARGVDCVGLVALACGQGTVPGGYALRTADAEAVTVPLRALGFRKRRFWKPGDVLLFDAGPAQLHLGLWTGEGVIHADAGLRRVVETPGPPRWPVLSIWRR